MNVEIRSWTYLKSPNKIHGKKASKFEEKVLDNYINSVERIEKICNQKSAEQNRNIVTKQGKKADKPNVSYSFKDCDAKLEALQGNG